MAPKMVATCLEIPPGAPKSRSKDLFFGSKRRKRGFQKRGQKRDPPKAFDTVKIDLRWNARRNALARS